MAATARTVVRQSRAHARVGRAARALVLVCALLATARATSALHVHPTLAAYFSFDWWLQEGEAFKDDSGHGWQFQVVGGDAATLATAGDGVSPGPPRFGPGALAFTGASGQFGVCGFPLSGAAGAELSASAWVWPAGSPAADSVQYILSNRMDGANDGPFWGVERVGPAHVRLAVRTKAAADAAAEPTVSSSVPLPVGGWQHLAVTRSTDGSWALYVNGLTLATMDVVGQVQPGAPGSEDAMTLIGGRTPHAPVGDTQAFSGMIDNVRLYRAALSAAQVSDLYYSDEGLPQPIALPVDGWSGNYVQTRRVYGSSIGGGAFDETDTTTGSAFFDAARQRAVRRGTLVAASGAEVFVHEFVFSTEAGQLEMSVVIPTDEPAAAVCTVTEHACPSWPQSFACLPGGAFECEPATCPTTRFWTQVQWDGPPPACSEVDPPGSVQCETAYAHGGTKAVTQAGGTPALLEVGACSPSAQSISCWATTVTFSDVTTGAQSDELFAGPELANCFASAATCTAFCNGRGTCDPAEPGVCVCDDPSVWAGPQCDRPVDVSCELSEWSAWGACSAKCGGGTQTRTASWVPPASDPDMACTADVKTQSRACNTAPCDDVPCASCVGGTSGPCRNDANGVCYGFYAGTTTCPAGTTQCGANCASCVGGTFGPCQHDNDQTCMAFLPSLSGSVPTCPAGTTQCALAPRDPKQCGGCWPGTAGPCQQSNTVCWAALPSGKCPAGTTKCEDGGSLPAAVVTSADLQLDGVTADEFRASAQAAFANVVANIADAPALNLRIEAVRAASPSGAVWVSAACLAGTASCDDATSARSIQVGFIVVPEVSDAGTGGGTAAAQTVRARTAAAALEAAVRSGELAVGLRAQGVHAQSTQLLAPVLIVNEDESAVAADEGPSTASSLTVVLAVTGIVVVASMAAAAAAVAVTRRRSGDAVTRIGGEPPRLSSWTTVSSYPMPTPRTQRTARRVPSVLSNFGSMSSFSSMPPVLHSPAADSTLGGDPLPAPAPVTETMRPRDSVHQNLRSLPVPNSPALSMHRNYHTSMSRDRSSSLHTVSRHVW